MKFKIGDEVEFIENTGCVPDFYADGEVKKYIQHGSVNYIKDKPITIIAIVNEYYLLKYYTVEMNDNGEYYTILGFTANKFKLKKPAKPLVWNDDGYIKLEGK